MPYNTGLAVGNGLMWVGKQYTPSQLPEFLIMLRRNGVEDLGQWLQTHPAVEAKLGLAPVALLKTPVVVTQQIKYPPGSFSGWHSHPGYLTATVVSGQVTRFDTNCKSETFTAGQSFYETGTQTFIVKNTSSDDAVLTATYVAPVATPTTGLRIDRLQPTACSQ